MSGSEGLEQDDYKSLEITLTGSNNRTLKGVLNFTAIDLGNYSDKEEIYDSNGAATFVIVVILVYGLSIVMMIGSLAKKNMKVKDVDLEEKQILSYLNQANDLREKSAKDNYRQLKRNIISIVNKYPNTPEAEKKGPALPVVDNVIRSMLAVGSPSIALATASKITGLETSSSRPTSPVRSGRLTSDTDSLKALLEEDEPDSEDGGSNVTQAPDANSHSEPPPLSVITTKAQVIPPKDTIVSLSSGTSLATHGVHIALPRKYPGDTSRGRSLPSGIAYPTQKEGSNRAIPPNIPRVVISNPDDTQRKRPPPLDIERATDTRLTTFERDSRIICNVAGSDLRESNNKCELSMDTEGNIWIMQSSPGSPRRPPPSPSLSTPGSISYESLGSARVSRTPSPSPDTRISSPGMFSSTISTQRGRQTSTHSQALDPTQVLKDCCEHNHGIVRTASALLPSGRKSPSFHDFGQGTLLSPDTLTIRRASLTQQSSPATNRHSRPKLGVLPIAPTTNHPNPEVDEPVHITSV